MNAAAQAEIDRLTDALLACAAAPCYRLDPSLGICITAAAQRIAREALGIGLAPPDIPIRTLEEERRHDRKAS